MNSFRHFKKPIVKNDWPDEILVLNVLRARKQLAEVRLRLLSQRCNLRSAGQSCQVSPSAYQLLATGRQMTQYKRRMVFGIQSRT